LTLDEEVIGVPYKVTLWQRTGRRVKVVCIDLFRLTLKRQLVDQLKHINI